MNSRQNNSPLRCFRSGFTLVELMAMIAIIGLVMAMLLPAVQSVRESARRSACQGNLKQIGAGVQQYAQAMGDVLPPGQVFMFAVNAKNGNGQSLYHGSTTMYLLPYIEQLALYSAYYTGEPLVSYSSLPDVIASAMGSVPTLVSYGGGGPNISNDGARIPGTNKNVSTVSIATYLCPSDYVASTLGRLNYIGSAGPANKGVAPCSTWTALINSGTMPATGSVGVPGVFGRFDDVVAKRTNTTWGNVPNVVFSIGDCRCKLSAITDGLSTTIIFGEALPDFSFNVGTGWGSVINGCGRGNTLVPLNAVLPAGDVCATLANERYSGYGFRSRHAGGVSFLMADGVVNFFADTIDYRTLQQLGAKADGRLLNAY